jgi:hypothetical protein
MTKDKEEPIENGKEAVSLYLSKIVLFYLEKKASELKRSKSWIADESLRRDLGLLPEGVRK